MPPFRRVEDRRAGPTALGILVPPGLRTLVILRPRGLEWDLLPLRPDEAGAPPGFCDFGRDDAAGVARRVQRALQRAAEGAAEPVSASTRPAADGHCVIIRAGELSWAVCKRLPGQPYRVHVFATLESASAAGAGLALFLSPGGEAEQEYYFNTQNFSH